MITLLAIVETSICTILLLEVHGPLPIFQLKRYVPDTRPVTVVVARFANVMAGKLGPLINDHSPVPIDGILPVSMAEDVHIVWSAPASATVGLS